MLAGYLAAGFSKSGKIATYGGLAFPGVTRFMDGMYAGIKYYNEQKGTHVTLLGWDGSLPDPTKTGRSSAGVAAPTPGTTRPRASSSPRPSSTQGVDIVHPGRRWDRQRHHQAAMLAAGKWAIGVDTDQSISIAESAGGHPHVRRRRPSTSSVLDLIKKNEGGDLGGEDYSGRSPTRASCWRRTTTSTPRSRPRLKAELETLKAAIIAGTVKVCTYLGRGC